MHPVLEHILARREKKVPVDDGRKIALVLFGGIMCGIRGIGSLIALDELGLRNAFDSVYVISAGLPNISYFLDNKIRLAASIYYDDLSGKRFINALRFWKVADIDHLIKVLQYSPKKVTPVNIINHPTKVYVGMQNITTKQVEYLEIHDVGVGHYFSLLKAAVSVPVFHPGSTELNGKRYKDVGRSFVNSRAGIHVRTILESDATDILFIYNRFDQYRKRFEPSERTFEVLPPDDKLGMFETRRERLIEGSQRMGDVVKRAFGNKEPISLTLK